MDSAAGVMVSGGAEVQRTSSSNLGDLLRIDFERGNSANLLDFLRIKQEGCCRNNVSGCVGGGGSRVTRQTLGDVLTLTKDSVSNQRSLFDAIRDDPSSSGSVGIGGDDGRGVVGSGGVVEGGGSGLVGSSGSGGSGAVGSGGGGSGVGSSGGGGVLASGSSSSGVVGSSGGGVVGSSGGGGGGVVEGGGSTREIKKNWRQLRKKMKLGRGAMSISAPDVPVDSNSRRLSLSELLQRNASVVLDRGRLNVYNSVGNTEQEAAGEGPGESSGGVVEPARMSLMALLGEADSAYIINDREMEEEENEKEDEGEEEVGKLLEYNACCVCMVRHKGAAFIPCGHTFCRLCSRELYVQRGNCPLCNNLIMEILDIF